MAMEVAVWLLFCREYCESPASMLYFNAVACLKEMQIFDYYIGFCRQEHKQERITER